MASKRNSRIVARVATKKSQREREREGGEISFFTIWKKRSESRKEAYVRFKINCSLEYAWFSMLEEERERERRMEEEAGAERVARLAEATGAAETKGVRAIT